MTKPSDKSTLAIIETANEWLIRLHDQQVSAADESAFDAWLRESPAHVREFLRAESVWSALESVDAKRSIDLELLLSECHDNVTPLNDSAVTDREHAPATSQRWAHPVLWIATAATAVLAVLLAWWYATLPESQHYVTGLGEQRRLVLDDGSIVDMNTQSELTVRLSDSQRQVLLLRGEALFTVAKDPDRPFIVTSQHVAVRALGTQFNIYEQEDRVLVTVLEGRVRVASLAGESATERTAVSGSGSPQSVELDAGDAAEVRPGAPIRKTIQVNTERALAWTERRLIFDNESLSVIAAEFNRYNSRQLVIQDAGLATKRISAVFDAHRPDTLVRFLAQNEDVQIDEASPSQVVIKLAD
jgi:transmembrane sensor